MLREYGIRSRIGRYFGRTPEAHLAIRATGKYHGLVFAERKHGTKFAVRSDTNRRPGQSTIHRAIDLVSGPRTPG